MAVVVMLMLMSNTRLAWLGHPLDAKRLEGSRGSWMQLVIILDPQKRTRTSGSI
jgi:hypothetical protein